MASETLTLVVLLHVDPRHMDDYARYEGAASHIMKRHGGRIERRIGLTADTTESGEASRAPHEVHLVTFPSEDAFDDYIQDPALAEWADLRARVIQRTEVWRGKELPSFDSTSHPQKSTNPEEET